MLLDNAGETVNQISYDAFGNITSETDSTVEFRYVFTGIEIITMIKITYFQNKGQINKIQKVDNSLKDLTFNLTKYTDILGSNSNSQLIAIFSEQQTQDIIPVVILENNEYIEHVTIIPSKNEFMVLIYDCNDSQRINKYNFVNYRNHYNQYFIDEEVELDHLFSDGEHILFTTNNEPQKTILRNLDDNTVYFFEEHVTNVEFVSVFEKDNIFVSCDENNFIKVWDLKNKKCLKTLKFQKHIENILLINSTYIVGMGDSLYFWIFNLKKEEFLLEKENYSDPVIEVDIINNLIFIGKEDGYVDCISLTNGNTIWSKSFSKNSISIIEISQDKEMLFMSSIEGAIYIADANNGELIHILKGHSGEVWNIISTTNNIITSGFDETIRVWDRYTKDCKLVLAGHAHKILGMTLSHDNNHLISWDKIGYLITWEANWNEPF